MVFNNGIVLAQNRLFHVQQHKPTDVPALFDGTRLQTQEILVVQAYRYLEKGLA